MQKFCSNCANFYYDKLSIPHCKKDKPLGIYNCSDYLDYRELLITKKNPFKPYKEVKMSCYDFCTLMPKLVETHLAREKWIDNATELIGINCEFFYQYDFMTILMDLLVELLDDKNGWLEYFIFEKKCQWFDYEEDGEVHYVDSYNKLYNLIIGD